LKLRYFDSREATADHSPSIDAADSAFSFTIP
jgi:hypothetical protein